MAMTEEMIRAEARSLKVWILDNKTKCITFAAIVVILDRIVHAFLI